MSTPLDLQTLNHETHTAWETKAEHWDSHLGDNGNLFQSVLVNPASERLLAIQPGERVLDVACGNGVFARRLVALGAQVTAVDFSARLIELARMRPYADRIDYRVVDATDEAALVALGKFDAIVCNMGIMDIADINPLFRAAPQLLTANGRFVFSMGHPCFNMSDSKLALEQEDRDGEVREIYSLRIYNYLHSQPEKGTAIIGEPAPHYYFPRPLHELFNAGFANGLVVDGLEEPAFREQHQSNRPLSWVNFKHIPPVISVRMRVSKR